MPFSSTRPVPSLPILSSDQSLEQPFVSLDDWHGAVESLWLIRNVALFGRALFTKLGVRNGTLILTLIGCILFPVSLLFLKYGERIRNRSRFAPT